MSIGTITNIRADNTVDASIITIVHGEPVEDYYQNVKVFYHCQGAKDTTNGVLAFRVGDEAMILHSPVYNVVKPSSPEPYTYDGCIDQTPLKSTDRQRTEPYVIGFSDTELRYCSAPLIAGGDKCKADQTMGRALAWYDPSLENKITCTPISQYGLYTQSSFFQVKYLKEDIQFDKVEIVDGAEVRTQTSHKMIVGMAISKGYILQEGPGDEIKNKVVVSITDLNTFKIHQKEFNIDQFGTANTTSLSANFNSDKTKLFIVHAISPEDFTGDPSGGVSYAIYERRISDNADEIFWDMKQNGSYSFDYWMQYAYVDKNGIIWGPFKPTSDGDGLTQYQYITINIFSGSHSTASKNTIGMSVIDGDFAGIYSSVFTSKPANSDTMHGNIYTFYCAGNSTEGLVDDGYQMVDTSDPPCTYPDYCNNACDQPACQKMRSVNQSWVYWFERVSLNDENNQFVNKVSYGDSSFNAVTGRFYHVYVNTKSHPHFAAMMPCSGWACQDWVCQSVSTTIEVDNSTDRSNLTSKASCLNGCAVHNSTGTRIYSQLKINEPCTGPCVCAVPENTTGAIDCGCYARPYPDNTWSYYYAAGIGYCGSLGELINDDRDNRNDIKFPYSIVDASPISSFAAHDHNDPVMSIRGMKYIRHGATLPENIIEINGDDVKEMLFSCTGFNDETFNYIGFLF